MAALHLLVLSLLCTLFVYQCHGACAEVDSDTEAVADAGFKLGCISCKRRSEVEGYASIEWYFRARGEVEFVHIYTYNEDGPIIENEQFLERIYWNGSKRSTDIQDASIYLFNVTFNDSGTYRCFFNRTLFYSTYKHTDIISKVVHLNVVAKGFRLTSIDTAACRFGMLIAALNATRGTASIVSEVMMYVSIIGLQVWLLIEMIYCYRKIAAAGEEALREAANAEYLAIASESKDNCAGVQVGE